MDIGVCVASKIDDVGYIAHAENLGYSHAWVADSQMIWSDCYAVLALAAQRTRTIRLGTGVAIAGTRTAPVTAHSIATINRLAPGRTFLGIGTGNTALRLMGQRPIKLAEYAEYLRVVRALLRGAEVDYTFGAHGISKISAPIAFQMPDLGFIALDPPIPLYVSGFGPKAQALAGEYGDGLVMSIHPEPDFVHRTLRNVQKGADRAGRALDGFLTCSLTAAVVLGPGDRLTDERVIREAGPFALSSLHYVYERVRFEGGEPPAALRPIWQDYVAAVEAVPASHRHLRIHAGHCTFIHPDEARFVTPELIRASCLVGGPEELVEKIRALHAAGLGQLMLLPSLETQYRVLEDFSRQVMAKL
jgi:alkanesulfonate monooxygenase SsuD/methylene tetrahydromethanopterin reductase-like flavin-dependent oxidoreductase (luciferase family)